MPYTVVTDAASEPISLTEAKLHLKVDFSADDNEITILIKAARQAVEQYTNLALLPKTIDEVFDEFPQACRQKNPFGAFSLTVSPVSSVTSITYTKTDETSTTVAASVYDVDTTTTRARIAPKVNQYWPTDVYLGMSPITIRYVAGYADTTALPAPLRQAMLLTIGHWYRNREDTVRKMPTQAEWLLNKYRVFVF